MINTIKKYIQQAKSFLMVWLVESIDGVKRSTILKVICVILLIYFCYVGVRSIIFNNYNPYEVFVCGLPPNDYTAQNGHSFAEYEQDIYNEPSYSDIRDLPETINPWYSWPEAFWDLPHTWGKRPFSIDLELSANVYMRFIEQEQYTGRIRYEMVNTSDYYYNYGSFRGVARLIDDEWYVYYGYLLFRTLILYILYPHASIERFVHPSTEFPEGYIFDGGSYKFIKEISRGQNPRENRFWTYFIVQLD